MEFSKLHEWAQRAYEEIGWDAGLMTWQYSNDKLGVHVNTYLDG